MKKILKRAVVMMVAFFSVITILPTDVNCFTNKVYASTTDGKLTELELKKSSGGSIQIYDHNDYKSKNEVDDDELEPKTK